MGKPVTPAPGGTSRSTKPVRPLSGVRVVSLALNLPGPAALQRLRAMGARCTKIEPPSGDPMKFYSETCYDALRQDIPTLTLDLKADAGRARLERALDRADVLLTSFRPSALRKLGLDWASLRKRYPALSLVAIVGAPGERAEEPGHDLTYEAEAGLVTGLQMPASLLADMGGAMTASEAVLQALLVQRHKGRGVCLEVALSEAAQWLALPRAWDMMGADRVLGGAHAGYRVYPCKDGRVALAALEPHFAAALSGAVGLPVDDKAAMTRPATREAIAAFLAGRTRRQLEKLARERDIPLHTLK